MAEEDKDKTKTGTEGTTTSTDDGKGQEPTTFTQADVDRIIKERLEREGIKDLKAKAKELDDFKKGQMTAEDAAKATVAELQQKLVVSEAERASLRLAQLKDELLDKAGLPRGWSKRIIGTSEQEIMADIDALRRQLAEGGVQTVGGAGNPADRARAGNKPTLTELLQRAIR